MRIINCFPYFNEKELLELRIRLLSDKIDLFIITDANKTHKGLPKEFTCKKTLQELNLLSDKIKIVEVDLPSYDEEPNAWVRERIQRNAASQYIEDDDVCIITDCDEIINPDFINYYVNITKQNENNILRIPMVFLMGGGDLRAYNQYNNPIPWTCPFICMKCHLDQYTLSDIRESNAIGTHHIKYTDIFASDDGKVYEAGWHFSWMGDLDRLNTKNSAFAHWGEFNISEDYIAKENSFDPLGRTDHILKHYPTNFLPPIIFDLKTVKDFLGLTTNPEHILLEVGEKNYFNWEGHREFASWIINEINPQITVDLGVDYGYSSFCFALPNKGIVYGIDSFEGDLHAGQRNTYDYVLNKQKQLNLNNLIFVKGYFEEIAKVWNQEINILHIDGFHTYEAVKNDYENWSKFVSDDGVILFHDTIVDHPTFGVRKFFEEINLPKLNFTHCNGLGVVSKNQNLIEKIKLTFPNLTYEHKSKKAISIIQIGTNRANDDLSKYLKLNHDSLNFGLFVEPISSFNSEILNCYKKYNNIIIENVAIIPQNWENGEKIEMFYHTGDPTYETTSCIKDHLNKHEQFYQQGEIKSFYAPCMSLSQLFKKYNIKELDWLLLDIEGIDAEIILSFEWDKYNIKRIEFEHLHLGDKKNLIKEMFLDKGYIQINALHQFDWAFIK